MTTEQFAELLTDEALQAFEAAKRISPEWAGTVDPYIDEIRDKGGTF